jgi:hypothetical protein
MWFVAVTLSKVFTEVWLEAVTYFKVVRGICLEGLWKTTDNLKQGIWSLGTVKVEM